MTHQWRGGGCKQIRDDLAEVSGNRLDSVLNPVTDRPPAFLKSYEDEINEMNCYFGQDVARSRNIDSSVDDNITPDYEGILLQLKMVREFDHNDPSSSETKLLHSDNSALVITKPKTLVNHVLNPNVKEFVPASMMGKNNNETTNQEAKAENNSKENNTTTAGQSSSIVPDINKTRIDPSKLQPHEAGIIANELKNKIKEMSKTSKSNKLHRNVALLSLTKCYSVLSTPEPQQSKLLTPEYFQVSGEPNEKVAETSKKEEKDAKEMTAYIKQSIDKVEHWQQSIEETKSPDSSKDTVKAPTVFKPQLVPITYKKKQKIVEPVVEVSSSTSPSLASSLSSSKQYVPTQSASEIYEQIKKQIALRDARADISIWDKVQRQLREKEELNKQKALEEKNL